VVTAIVVAGIISRVAPPVLTASFGAVVIGAALPLVIAGGPWHLVRERGVTLHAVAGALHRRRVAPGHLRRDGAAARVLAARPGSAIRRPADPAGGALAVKLDRLP
jgi:hypothetical protein